MEHPVAFDIGTGTGILAAVLARRGVSRVIATDIDQRAVDCAKDNISKLGVGAKVEVIQADLFPPGKASLIVCNPPWIPAKPSSSMEYSIFDFKNKMLLSFLSGLKERLLPRGEGWLIMSDIAEHLELRSRDELFSAFTSSGLKVVATHSVRPTHPKVAAEDDPLHAARMAEVVTLWRLAAVVEAS